MCLHYCLGRSEGGDDGARPNPACVSASVYNSDVPAVRLRDVKCPTYVGEFGDRGGFIVNIRLSFINISPAANDDSHCRSICELLRIPFAR